MAHWQHGTRGGSGGAVGRVSIWSGLCAVLGHEDRHAPLRAYVKGLLFPGGRKSVEPMAARIDPRHVRARHQSMHHFVANAGWVREVLRNARDYALEPLERHAPVAPFASGSLRSSSDQIRGASQTHLSPGDRARRSLAVTVAELTVVSLADLYVVSFAEPAAVSFGELTAVR